MKKIIVGLTLLLLTIVFATPSQAKDMNYGPWFKEKGLSGQLNGSTLILSGANNPFKTIIHVKNGEKKPFSTEMTAICNRKLPPDCTFFFDFSKVLNCKALGICKKSAKAALRKIKRGKRFAATASYSKKSSVTKKKFSCRKTKNSKISCRVKKS